jgi:hypothetical protein
METDAPARGEPRVRSWLLIVLGIAVVAFVVMKLWPSAAAPVAPTSNASSRAAGTAKAGAPIDPASLDVKLEALKQKPPGPGEAERNPFQFKPKPPPPPPEAAGGRNGARPAPPPPPVNTGPPPPPPIPLKFFGIVEKPGAGKIAALSDCRSTYYGREGDIVAGQYRLVRIGIESVVMEYPDGRGRTTIRMSSQDCVTK